MRGRGRYTVRLSEPRAATAVRADFPKPKGLNMVDVGGVAVDRLRSFVERIERLEEDRSNLTADIREVMSEAKSAGFDAKALRQVVRLRKLDPDERQEQEHLLEVYRRALEI